MDTLPNEVRYAEPIQLFRNLGDRTFEEIAESTGLNDGPLHSRRGTAFGDLNNDGNLDIAVFNAAGPPSLFINQASNSNHRVLFRLIGTKSNSAAIGARVAVITSRMTQIDEVRGGGSYNSTNDTRLHFGLGNDKVIDKVEVQWPSGLKQEFLSLAGDAIYEITEGQCRRRLRFLLFDHAIPWEPLRWIRRAPAGTDRRKSRLLDIFLSRDFDNVPMRRH